MTQTINILLFFIGDAYNLKRYYLLILELLSCSHNFCICCNDDITFQDLMGFGNAVKEEDSVAKYATDLWVLFYIREISAQEFSSVHVVDLSGDNEPVGESMGKREPMDEASVPICDEEPKGDDLETVSDDESKSIPMFRIIEESDNG